jgi:transcriptional regulator with XRE-family HTH domain
MTIAGQVKSYRRMRGLSAQQLADACASLGHPIQRSVLANLESGRRATVSIADLVVLSKALGVPPILLIYPVGAVAAVEVLPAEFRHPWSTLKWFVGESAYPAEDEVTPRGSGGGTPEDNQAFFDTASTLMFFREHDRIVFDWLWEHPRLRIIEEAYAKSDSESERKILSDNLAGAKKRLAELERQLLPESRNHMRDAGVVPPPLPAPLAHLIGESDYVVYERVDRAGRVRERRVVDRGGQADHELIGLRPEWAELGAPFRERPSDFNLDEE